MKTYSLSLLTLFSLFILYSCNEEDTEDFSLSTCINVDKEIIDVGEIVKISNCSTNYTSFEFQYFDDRQNEQVTSTDSILELSFSTPGNYTISLMISDQNGNSETETVSITVNDVTDKLFLIDTPQDFSSMPLAAGLDEITGDIYYIDSFGLLTGRMAYRYRVLDAEFNEVSNTFLRERTENGGSAFRLSFPNDKKIIYMVNTFSTSYFSRQITISQSNNIAVDFTGISVVNGSLNLNDNRLFFGSESEYINEEQRFKNYPAIEIRDNANDIVERKIFTDLNFQNSIISDLIVVDDGFVAFGAAFENDGNSLLNYTPLLIFFDPNLEITEIKEFTSSQLNSSDTFISYDNLNRFMHIEKLSSGNLVTYGLGEIRVMNSKGEELFSRIVTNLSGGTLLKLNDSFVISRRGYLAKYDETGNLIKEIFTNGVVTTNLNLKDDRIIFVSAFESKDSDNITVFRPFIGEVDTDLNFIDLNN